MDKKQEDFFTHRRQAYHAVFNPESEATKTVLKDLCNFCRGESTTFHPDARAHAVLEGRREVWLRLQEHLNLSVDEFLRKKGKNNDSSSRNNDD